MGERGDGPDVKDQSAFQPAGEGATKICESESIGLTLPWQLAAGAFFSRCLSVSLLGVLFLTKL